MTPEEFSKIVEANERDYGIKNSFFKGCALIHEIVGDDVNMGQHMWARHETLSFQADKILPKITQKQAAILGAYGFRYCGDEGLIQRSI